MNNVNWPKQTRLTFFFFFAAAFLIRVKSVSFGLPYLYHADEPIIVNHALAYGTGDFNPHFFKIPPLLSYLLFFCYGIFFLTLKALGQIVSTHDFEILFYSDPTAFYLIARIIFGVLLGALSVAFFYTKLRHFFPSRVIIPAAIFFTFCFIHVRDSHYLYADIPLVFAMTLGMSYFCRMLTSHQITARMSWYSGMLIGISIAIKYNGIALAIPYLLILIKAGKKSATQLFMTAIISGLGVFLTYLLLNPYTLLDWHTFKNEILMQSKSQGGVGWAHHLFYSLWEGVGPGMIFLSGIGLMKSMRQSGCGRMIGIFTISYYGVLAIAGQPYDRYILPLVPWLCLFSSEGIYTLSNLIKNKKIKQCFFFALLMIVLTPNLMKSLKFNALMSKPDTRTLAKLWVESNIPPESKIALDWDFYMPRLSFSSEQLHQKMKRLSTLPSASHAQKNRLEYLLSKQTIGYNIFFLSHSGFNSESRFLFAEPTVQFSLDELKKIGIRYIISGSFSKTENSAWLNFQKSLKDNAILIQSFSPYRLPSIEEVLDLLPLTGGPFTWKDLFNRERNGPVIRIYQIS